jgi:urease accessory protein
VQKISDGSFEQETSRNFHIHCKFNFKGGVCSCGLLFSLGSRIVLHQQMHIIHHSLSESAPERVVVRIPVERLVLAKRRWRGLAEDGTEFGFDLESPLSDGAMVLQSESATYVLAQKYEPVLEVALGKNSQAAAKLGWVIGNLHFSIEVADGVVRVVDDPAVRQLFEREDIAYVACKRVFHPLSGGHRH